METENYSIETYGHGGFQVWIERSKGESGHVAISFPSYQQARDWIVERARLGPWPPSDEPGGIDQFRD
jgi:hypothetical protein